MTTTTQNTAKKVANTLRFAGYKAICHEGGIVTVKGLNEADRVELERMISNIYKNFKGLIFSI